MSNPTRPNRLSTALDPIFGRFAVERGLDRLDAALSDWTPADDLTQESAPQRPDPREASERCFTDLDCDE